MSTPTRLSKSITILSIVVLSSAVAPQSASAQEQLNCDAYAASAVAQHEENTRNDCGLTGPRWSTDYNGHANWCRSGARMADLTTEDNARRDALVACAQSKMLRLSDCQTYANNAVEHQAANESLNCGFQGGAWSRNYQGHFDWCLGTQANLSSQEDAMRFNQLKGCISAQRTSKEASCNTYAAIAVAQNQSNVDRGCGFTGGRWSNDQAGHFNWCMGVIESNSEQEQAVRATALNSQCTVTICSDNPNKKIGPIPTPLSGGRTCRTVPR